MLGCVLRYFTDFRKNCAQNQKSHVVSINIMSHSQTTRLGTRPLATLRGIMGMEVGGKQKVSPVLRKNPCLQQCTDLLMLQEEVCSFLQRKVGRKWSYTHAPPPPKHNFSYYIRKTPCKVQRQMYSSIKVKRGYSDRNL